MQARNKQGQFRKRFNWKWDRKDKISAALLLGLLTISSCHGLYDKYKPTDLVYKATPRAYADEIIVEKEITNALLERIADCESGGKQFYDDGRVVLNVNKDGSADVGKWQINLRYHGAELARQKLDVINSEADNETFARYLYEKNGTADWSASKKCWNK